MTWTAGSGVVVAAPGSTKGVWLSSIDVTG